MRTHECSGDCYLEKRLSKHQQAALKALDTEEWRLPPADDRTMLSLVSRGLVEYKMLDRTKWIFGYRKRG